MRRVGLARVVPLRRGGPLERTGGLLPYRRRNPVTPAVRFVVWTRAGAACERCGYAVDLDGFDAHHRQRRSLGDHTPANLAVLCRSCHGAVHANPTSSKILGWIVTPWDSPGDVPLWLADGRRVRLAVDGTYQEAA